MMTFLENRLIGTKLGLGFGSVLVLTLIVGIVGIFGINTLLDRSDKVGLSNKLDKTVVDMQIARGSFVNTGSEEDRKKLMAVVDTIDNYLQNSDELYVGKNDVERIQQLKKLLVDYKKTIAPFTAARRAWNDIDDQAQETIHKLFNQYDVIINEMKKDDAYQSSTIKALTVEKELYALTSLVNEMVSKNKPIPLDDVRTTMQSIISQTSAFDIPSNLQPNKANLLSLLNQYADLGKKNPEVSSNLFKYKDQLLSISRRMNTTIDALTLSQTQKSKEDGEVVNQMLIIVVIVAIAIGIFFALFIRHMIVKPMQDVALAVEAISSGDLTQQLRTERKDELGQLYNNIGKMSLTLNTLISEVISGVMNLSSTSEQLEAISKKGQNMMQSQRDETDQVATAINEMSSTVAEVARNAETAADATSKTDNIVNQGNVMVNGAVKQIESLADNLNLTSQTMEQLKARTDNVGNVLEVIKAVAEQTNLLALNAAIEAARAGEAGRGFAVVADEVRGLASRTQSSAKEIEDLITELQTGAQDALNKMLTSRDMSIENAENAKGVLTLFSNINEQVGHVQDMNQQIATASEEQSQVSEEINRSVENVRSLAEQTSEGAVESVSAVGNLRTLSQQLKTLTDRFKTS